MLPNLRQKLGASSRQEAFDVSFRPTVEQILVRNKGDTSNRDSLYCLVVREEVMSTKLSMNTFQAGLGRGSERCFWPKAIGLGAGLFGRS